MNERISPFDLTSSPFELDLHKHHASLVYLQVQKTKKMSSFQTPHLRGQYPMKKGECYRQNHRDRTNLCMLSFEDNKDWHRNGLTLPIGNRSARPSLPPGIRSNQNTQINCGLSARMAGNVCANVDQIRRQGRWNNTTINGAYLTNLSREFVRSIPTRAALNPPTSLCKKLFPAIGE
ncbi:hypothetical protein [Absidia glauca]|uniref:Ndc10 domain-containing protein n=1 Tax=Absidia glauca TaxID=4829 RepID=A0A163JPP2_ABSGL|nr:hypothetical protein [Absidia glauca]